MKRSIDIYLENTNFTKDTNLGIWLTSTNLQFAYSDGDDIENYLLNTMRAVTDLSVYSNELREKIKDWPSNYHLSPRRSNLLFPFKEWFQGKRILEIGCGCGAITRFLGECNAEVISVEGSLRRAQIARERCRGLDNIEIICTPSDQLPELGEFDAILLIGVLEYAKTFLGVNGQSLMLEDCYSRLAKNGQLFIAIENKLGIKYFAGANEDHLGKPMLGINDTYTEHSVTTFGRKELIKLLNNAGFDEISEYLPLPDYKLPVSIVTPLGWNNYSNELTVLAVESMQADAQGASDYLFSLEMATRSVWLNDLAPDLSNSFLMITTKKGQPQIDSGHIAAYHLSVDRLTELSKYIIFHEVEPGSLSVSTHSLTNKYAEPNPLHSLDISNTEFIKGESYFFSLVQIVNRPNWSVKDIASWVKPWIDNIITIANAPLPYDQNTEISATFFDALPFNTIKTGVNSFSLFDLEWQSKESELLLGYLTFRAIFNSLIRISSCASSELIDGNNIALLSLQTLQELKFDVTAIDLENYLNKEATFAVKVTNFDAKALYSHLKNVGLNIRYFYTKAYVLSAENKIKALSQAKLGTQNALDNANLEIKALSQAQLGTQNALDNTKLDLQIIQTQLQTTQELLHSVLQSSSWRFTAPIRKIVTMLHNGRGFIRKGHGYIKKAYHLAHTKAIKMGGWSSALKAILRIFRTEGITGITSRLREKPSAAVDVHSYQNWIQLYDTYSPDDLKKAQQQIATMASPPIISIIMPVYNPPIPLLKEAIESIRNQIYPYWELCIADDASPNKGIQQFLQEYAAQDSRIKLTFREKNGHISAASNSALALATGEFVALVDNDDLLPINALYEVAKVITQYPEVSMIYSDEDKLLDGKRIVPFFKPDWNPDLFLGINMFSHLGVYRRSLIEQVGGFRVGLEGSQDYDLALRCWEIVGNKGIYHIPKILYHWRIIPGSTAGNSDEKPYALLAAIQAKKDYLERNQIDAEISEIKDLSLTRIKYLLPINPPLVSIIIPTRDGFNLIKQCIDSIFQKTTYPKYEIIIIDNGSTDKATLSYLSELKQLHSNVIVIRDDSPFNYSALNNKAVKIANGELICLMNNDTEVITPEWLDEMVSQAIRPEIGAVGARLWYPNDTLQHGGVILGMGAAAGHAHYCISRENTGYFCRARLVQNYTAVTAACLVIKKIIFEEVGGLNEENLSIAYNDVDLCIRVFDAGYRNLWTPFTELYHHESATRGSDEQGIKAERAKKEVEYLKRTYGERLYHDPAYNINLDLKESFALAFPPRDPK